MRERYLCPFGQKEQNEVKILFLYPPNFNYLGLLAATLSCMSRRIAFEVLKIFLEQHQAPVLASMSS